MGIPEIIKYGFLSLDIIIFISLVLFLLVGFGRGWRRRIIGAISFLVPFILFMIFLTPIAKIISNINIGDMTLKESIMSSFAESTDLSLSKESQNVLDASVISVIKTAVYMVGIIVCWILSLIIKIILKICLRKFIRKDYENPDEKHSKMKMKSRFIGMGVGFVNFLTAFVVFLFPLFGSINVIDVSFNKIQEFNENVDPEERIQIDDIDLDEMHEAFTSSIWYKITKITASRQSGITLPAKYMGSIAAAEANGIRINMINELSLILPIAPTAYKISNGISNDKVLDLSKLSQNDINNINNFLEKSKLLKFMSPVVKDMLVSVVEDETYKKAIEEANLIEEINVAMSTLKAAVNGCSTLVIDFAHPISVLENEQLPECVNNIINELLKSKLVDSLLLPMLSDQIVSNIPAEYDELAFLFTIEKIKATLKVDVKNVLLIYQDLAKNTNLVDVIENHAKFDFSKDESIEALARALAKVLQFQMIVGNEEALIRCGLKAANNDMFEYDTLFKDVVPNWEEEKANLSKILELSLKLYNEHIKGHEKNPGEIVESILTKDEKGEFVFVPLLNQLAESKLFTKVLTNFLRDYIEKVLSDSVEDAKEILDVFNFEVLNDMSQEEFKAEIKVFMNIFEALLDMNVIVINEQLPLKVTKENVSMLIENAFESALVKGKERNIIEYLLKQYNVDDKLEELNITLNFDDINWETEKEKLINVFVALLDFGDINEIDFAKFFEERNDENKEKVSALFTAFAESQIFSNVIRTLIETNVKELGYDFTITDEDMEKINKNGWDKEIEVIFDIIGESETFLEDDEAFKNITGNKVTEIMLKASESVLGTKIIGLVLEDVLGKENLNILPTNQDGSYKYDLSNQATMKELANTIGSLVDLHNNMDSFELNGDNDDIIDNITSVLESLEDSDFVKDVVSEYFDVDTETLEELDFENASDVIKDVYEEYKKNPDEFDLENDPELKEKVENSELGKAILEQLGII